MSETIGEWQDRKKAQARRFMERDPSLLVEQWQNYETRFILIHADVNRPLVIGQLARDETGQPLIDLTDRQIEEWAAPLRMADAR